jgi:hypothetical protein
MWLAFAIGSSLDPGDVRIIHHFEQALYVERQENHLSVASSSPYAFDFGYRFFLLYRCNFTKGTFSRSMTAFETPCAFTCILVTRTNVKFV